MATQEIRVDESYTSFKNIDCFENACLVIDHMLRVLKNPDNNNAFWEQFVAKIPEAYHTRNAKDDSKEALLYLVCSNSFYISELFENADDDLAMDFLDKCEQECC